MGGVRRLKGLARWFACSLALASSATVSATVHEVQSGASIADALAKAAPGDTIRLAGGTYRENIVIDVPVTLTSDRGATIRGGYEGNVVHVTAAGTVVEGLHIA